MKATPSVVTLRAEIHVTPQKKLGSDTAVFSCETNDPEQFITAIKELVRAYRLYLYGPLHGGLESQREAQ